MADFCAGNLRNYMKYSGGYSQIDIFGMILNILSLVSLTSTSDFKATNLFKYLLAKCISDLAYLTFDLVININNSCVDCVLHEIYGLCQYGMEFVYFMYGTTSLLSIVLEVASNFNRYRVITQSFKFMDKFSFLIKILLILCFGLAFNFYWFFSISCDSSSSLQSNETNEYISHMSDMYYSDLIQVIGTAENSTQEIICPVILIILNVMTLCFMSKNLIRKQKLQRHPKTSASLSIATNISQIQKSKAKNLNLLKAEKAKTRTTQMVLLTSFITLIGNLPYYISYKFFFSDRCFEVVSIILNYISFFSSFFIYFCFLKKFRRFYRESFRKFIQIATFNKLILFNNSKKTEASISLSTRIKN